MTDELDVLTWWNRFKDDEAELIESFSSWLLTDRDLDMIEYRKNLFEKALVVLLRVFARWIYD